MTYCCFFNTRREFKFRGQSLVFGLNDLPISSIQIHKKKKSELAFALFRNKVLVLILGALMSAIFEVVTILYSFCESSGKQKIDLGTNVIPRLLTHHGVSLGKI